MYNIIQILYVLGKLKFKVRHVYREANIIADFLASFAVQSGRSFDFSENGILPTAGRLLLHQDQSGRSSVRLIKRVVCEQRHGVG